MGSRDNQRSAGILHKRDTGGRGRGAVHMGLDRMIRMWVTLDD